jgi:hypothetical protein
MGKKRVPLKPAPYQGVQEDSLEKDISYEHDRYVGDVYVQTEQLLNAMLWELQ